MKQLRPENKNCFLGTKHSHNDVYKLSLLENLFFGHMGFDFKCWWNLYNRLLKIFSKIMGIYECSLPWCFFRSCVRDFLIWKMCSFTKLYKKNHLGSRWGLIIIVSVIIVWWQVQLVETVISREQTSWFPVVKCS